jgi:regulator of replication initiation timing
MARGIQAVQTDASSTDALESYRELIELQKQIIELAQQNERAKLECRQLRDRVAAEVVNQAGTQRSLRQKANKAFAELPANLAKSNLVSFIVKEQSIC